MPAANTMPRSCQKTEYDYVVIGGGVSALGLIAELVEYRPGKSILVVDQHTALGGQWHDAYEYVRLHGHTWTYTVQGFPWPAEIEANRAHQASRQELLTYFKGIQDHLKAQGVEFLFGHEMTAKALMALQEYKVTLRRYERLDEIGSSKEGGPTFDIHAKRLVLCTHTRHNSPPFRKIMPDANGKPVPQNIYPYQIPSAMRLADVIARKQRIAIIGGGKTGADAIMHLHRQGVALEQFVWIKKHDLAYALRVPPDIEADLAGRTATFWSLLLCVLRGGLNNRITVCTSQGGPAREYGQPRAPVMATTGGGLLGAEELEVLRPVCQKISGIRTNAAGAITLESGEVVPCDWVVWCHGYDVERRNAEVPRGTMEFFLFDKGCYIPMNFFAGAATGGRPLGRALLLWEDGLLMWYHSYIWSFWCILCAKLGGAANSTTWWLKVRARAPLHAPSLRQALACVHSATHARAPRGRQRLTDGAWPRLLRRRGASWSASSCTGSCTPPGAAPSTRSLARRRCPAPRCSGRAASAASRRCSATGEGRAARRRRTRAYSERCGGSAVADVRTYL